MNPLLIDYGRNCFKIGRNMEEINYVYDLPENILNFKTRCTKNGNKIIANENGTSKLSDIFLNDTKYQNQTFLVSQHMDYEMKKENFLKTTFELYFETLCFEKGQTWLQPLLAYYSLRDQGNNNMILIDSGEDSTYFIPFYDDFIIKDSIERSPLAGKVLGVQFESFIKRMYNSTSKQLSRLEVQNLKESSLKICPNFLKYEKNIILKENFYWKTLILPDSTEITLKQEVYEMAEVLFRPNQFGFGGQGLAEKLMNLIKVK